MKNLTILVFCSCLVLFLSNCKKDVGSECDANEGMIEFEMLNPCPLYEGTADIPTGVGGGGFFDIDGFVSSLVSSIPNNVMGYQIALSYQEEVIRTASAGIARNSDVCDPLWMGDCNLINMASVTKYYTAVAVLKLLEENNISVNEPVAPYLPEDWIVPPGADTLSFWRFLVHRTGLQSTNDNFASTLSYEGLRNFIGGGIVNPGDQNTLTYLNANYAVMRIVIPKLWSLLPNAPAGLQGVQNIGKSLSEEYYDRYLTENIFVNLPSVGLPSLNPSPDSERTLYYLNDNDLSSGNMVFDDWAPYTGGGGWFMSAAQAAAAMDAIESGNDILSEDAKNIMKTLTTEFNGPGFVSNIFTNDGWAYGHGGDITSSSNETHALVLSFPNNLRLAIAMNSDGGGGFTSTNLLSWANNAYNASL